MTPLCVARVLVKHKISSTYFYCHFWDKSWSKPHPWFRAALPFEGLDSLQSLRVKLIPKWHQELLQENVCVVVSHLRLTVGWCKTTTQNTHVNQQQKGLEKKTINILEWPSHNSDRDPAEMLWHDLRRACHARNPSNYQISNNSKWFMEIIAAKGASTRY